MPTTVKLKDEPNRLVELFVGWRRSQNERVSKEDVLAEAVKDYVERNAPASLLVAMRAPDKAKK